MRLTIGRATVGINLAAVKTDTLANFKKDVVKHVKPVIDEGIFTEEALVKVLEPLYFEAFPPSEDKEKK